MRMCMERDFFQTVIRLLSSTNGHKVNRNHSASFNQSWKKVHIPYTSSLYPCFPGKGASLRTGALSSHHASRRRLKSCDIMNKMQLVVLLAFWFLSLKGALIIFSKLFSEAGWSKLFFVCLLFKKSFWFSYIYISPGRHMHTCTDMDTLQEMRWQNKSASLDFQSYTKLADSFSSPSCSRCICLLLVSDLTVERTETEGSKTLLSRICLCRLFCSTAWKNFVFNEQCKKQVLIINFRWLPAKNSLSGSVLMLTARSKYKRLQICPLLNQITWNQI